MKKILYFLLCILLCVGIGGSAFVLYKNFGTNKELTTQGGDVTLDDGQDGVTDFEEPSADISDDGSSDSSGDSS